MDIRLPRALAEHRGRLPTTDLYLVNPLRQLRREPGAARLPRLRHLTANAFRLGRTGIVSRYGTLRDIETLRQSGADRLVYIADDDFRAGAADPTLPPAYRDKLAAFVAGPWPALAAAADIVVASSPAIAALYGAKARLMDPVWRGAPPSLRHFDRPQKFEIVHLGTASHAADLAVIAPELARTLAAHPRARLTLFSGRAAPAALKGHGQVRLRGPMSWWRYKLVLPRLRFHLAIYPLADSPFNAARSANKLFEQALVGAASLTSPNAALAAAAGGTADQIFVTGGAQAWGDRIEALVVGPGEARRSAAAVRERIRAADPAGRAAEVWREILAGEL